MKARLIYLERREYPVKLNKSMQVELTQALAYYSNFLKNEIYAETDRERKQQLRERLFTANKLYFLFEQDSVRVRTGPEFHRNWERFSKELVTSKLNFG